MRNSDDSVAICSHALETLTDILSEHTSFLQMSYSVTYDVRKFEPKGL